MRILLLAAACAALLFGAYPPLSLVLPSFVCLVPFLWALEEAQTPRAAAKLGYWFGVIANGAVLYWMVVALWHFTPLSALGYAASLLLALGPLWALLAWGTFKAWGAHQGRPDIAGAPFMGAPVFPLWVVFPLLWTSLEWLLAHLSDLAFPWLGLGTSLTRVPTLVQWADLAGARGVTMWLAWANVMVFLALHRRRWQPIALVGATLVVALAYGSWRERTLAVRPMINVGVIQPNVGFVEKQEDRENIRLLNEALAMTRAVARDSTVRLIVWPEVAVPVYFVNRPHYFDSLRLLAGELSRPLLIGILDAEPRPDGSGKWNSWNAAMLLDSTGTPMRPFYRKRYLVPIVERVPFLDPDWFGNMQWFGGFERGRELPVYQVAGARFGVLICYESAFENLSRRYRRQGAELLVNITNDAWFGRTAAPYQHASHLVMRAIETRAGVARAANSGISQFVTPLGRPYSSTRLETDTIVADTVYTTDARTLYVTLGDWVGWLALAGTALIIAATLLIKRPETS